MTRSSAHTPVYWTLISAVMVLIAVILVAVWLLFDMMSYPAIMAHASEDAVRVTAIKNEIFKRFFEIFVTIASLLAGLSAILGIGTYALLKGRVERTIETQIEERVGWHRRGHYPLRSTNSAFRGSCGTNPYCSGTFPNTIASGRMKKETASRRLKTR